MKFSRLFSLTFLVVGLSLWTLAPYGGCACANTLGPNDGPPPTPTPDHGPKVDDLEHPASLVNNFGGSITTIADNVTFPPDPVAPPSTLSHNSTINAAASVIGAGGSTLPGGTSGYAACASGYIGRDGAPYPFAQLIFPLGSNPNLPFYAPNKRLRFSFKAGAVSVGKPFIVNFEDSVIGDYSWYRYQFTPATANWTSYVVYFPDAAGTPKFAQPVWGICRKWTSTSTCGVAQPVPARYVLDNVTKIDFQPIPSASTRQQYDFCVDDITFE